MNEQRTASAAPPRSAHLDSPIARRLARPGPKRILSLDGGGARGIITLTFLSAIERQLRNAFDKPDLVLADYFDLIGGTSVGAMIATLLALGKNVDHIFDRFQRWAPRIFEPSAWGWLSPRFDARRLRGFVQSEVLDWAMRSDRLRTGLCIVTKRLDTGSVWPVTNNPGDPYFLTRPARGNAPARIGNGDYKLLDLIRASTAAPSYFSPTHIRIFDGPDHGLFVDGAVSPHNNPALQLFMLAGISGYNLGVADIHNPDPALREAPRAWALGADKLLIVSVGTGAYEYRVKESGAAAWDAINALQGMVSDGQELALTLLQWMSAPPLRWSVDRVIGDLSRDCLGRNEGLTQPLLSFQRYDVPLERQWLGENLARIFTEEQLQEIRDFTSTRHLKTLAELSQAAAERQVRKEHFAAPFHSLWA